MQFDTCCRMIADLLCQKGQSSPRSLAKLVERSGLARSSVMLHLKHLEAADLVEKEEILRTEVGRPKTLFKPSTKLLEMLRTKSD